MATLWFKLKAFLYFGGGAVIIIGGMIVLSAPYNYTGYVATQGDAGPFSIYDRSGYYPQLEIAIHSIPSNASTVIANFVAVNNETSETVYANMTLTAEDLVPGSNPVAYDKRVVIDLSVGNYTVTMVELVGAGWVDVSIKQVTDSRTYAIIGGSLNIIGLIMGASGYFVPGTLIPSGDETIVDWGYEEPTQQ